MTLQTTELPQPHCGSGSAFVSCAALMTPPPWFIIAALSITIFSIACLKVVISSCLSAISTNVSASSTRRLSISSNKGCGATVLPRYMGIWAHFSNRTSLLPEVAVATWLLSLPAQQARLSATWQQSGLIATALSTMLSLSSGI